MHLCYDFEGTDAKLVKIFRNFEDCETIKQNILK